MERTTETIAAIQDFLTKDDDPELWDVALDYILADVEKQPDVMVEIGRCSHWLRPHSSWWTADGGFAYPAGYNPTTTRWSGRGLPHFDWSVILKWTGNGWEPAKRKSVRYAVRVAIPARTKRHLQAAVHTLWMTGKEKSLRFYGFRKKDDTWKCTAAQQIT